MHHTYKSFIPLLFFFFFVFVFRLLFLFLSQRYTASVHDFVHLLLLQTTFKAPSQLRSRGTGYGAKWHALAGTRFPPFRSRAIQPGGWSVSRSGDDIFPSLSWCWSPYRCLFMWSARWSDLEKHLSQWVHLNGLAPVCFLKCLVNSSLLAKRHSHPSHEHL